MDVVTFRWNLIQLPESEGITVTEAYSRCGVSRKSYYKWKKRFQQEGIDGVKNRSRRPKISSRKTDASTESEIVKTKTQYPRWGAYRIRNQLLRQGVNVTPKTVNTVLKRHEIPTLWQKERRNTHDLREKTPIHCVKWILWVKFSLKV